MPGLRITADGRVHTVTVNRPEVLNALNTALLEELLATLGDLGRDENCAVIVLTGAGDRSFIAGADIKEMDGKTPLEARAYSELGQEIAHMLEVMRKPTIAAVNGYALGGGCELAMACTIRIAADSARLGQPEINLGIVPGYAGTQRLSRLVGRGRALELLLTGDQVTAHEAHRLGLVNRVVPAADLMTEARSLAGTLAAKAPVAVRYILEAVHKGLEMPFPQAQVFEATLFGLVAATEDMREGTNAFLEKRKPEFKGK